MYFKRTGRMFLCTSKRLAGLSVLLAAVTCGNILYWITRWQNSGVVLCSMDVFLCVLHPSFLFMIFVPFCLLAEMAGSRFFTAPHICRLFQNRGQMIQQMISDTVIRTVLFELIIIICARFMAFVLFGTHLTINWAQPQSRYWHDTGHRLQQALTPTSFIPCFSNCSPLLPEYSQRQCGWMASLPLCRLEHFIPHFTSTFRITACCNIFHFDNSKSCGWPLFLVWRCFDCC